MRKDAIAHAKKALGAGTVKNVDNPPIEQVWFVESKLPDSEMLDLMVKAEERDARVVFWGDLKRSELEERLRLEPVELFERKPKKQPSNKRLSEAVTYLIQRGKQFYESIRQPERSRESKPELQY
jgi:hypothetical protein